MKVMISQPMNGRNEEDIKKEREKIIEKFNKLHIEVVNSFFDFALKNINNEPVYYLAKSIEVMANIDAVYFAKDWRTARGCRIERVIAEEYGIKILETSFIEYDEQAKIKRVL